MATTYQERANIYWGQANELLTKGEWSKAGEMAWGAVAEAVHALAEVQGRKLKTHAELRSYAKQVAQQLQDEHMWDTFRDAERYHANFYGDFMDEQEVRELFPLLKEFLEKIGRLLPPQHVGGQG